MGKNDRCHICDKDLGPYAHNKQKYCSEECKREGRRAGDRVRRQQIKMQKLMTPQECKRCKENFFYDPNEPRKYCKKCYEIVYGKEVKSFTLNKEPETKKCLDCNTIISTKRKRCPDCALKNKRKRSQVYNNKVSQEIKDYKNKKSKAIDPKFLVRNYSGNELSKQGLCNSFNL